MLTKLKALLYDAPAFDAASAAFTRYLLALLGIVIANPPAPLAAWIGTHPIIGMLIAAHAALIAAGNKNPPAPT